MKKRIKSLVALIMTVLICMQSNPMMMNAMTISNDYTLTADDSTDGYIVTSGGKLRFAENLTVNQDINMGGGYDGANNYVIIPASGTMNAGISTSNGYDYVQNSGKITSDFQLNAGTLTNDGYVSQLTVGGSGILFAEDGSSYDVLDIRNAGSGNAITSGKLSAGTMYMNAYAFSFECSDTVVNVSDHFYFSGTTELQSNIKVAVSDATKITTEGRDGLSVYCENIKYPMPAVTISGKTIGEIYALSADKTLISYEKEAVGYQSVQSATVKLNNTGLASITLKFASDNAWDTAFSAKVGSEAVTSSSVYTLAAGESLTLSVSTKKGLATDTYSGTLKVKLCTSEGNEFKTQDITGKLVVEKTPSISAPNSNFYTLSGTKGNNGFYTSNVKVKPNAGFQIAKTLSDAFTDTITYDESVTNPEVYLLKTSTGQITEKATLKTIKIDKEKPKVTGVTSGETYYGDEVSVKVTDEHLDMITVNGKPKTVTDEKVSFKLKGGDDSIKYVIKAEDLAGNIRKITVYLEPEWMKDGTVPGGKTLQLYKDKKYTLGNGTWMVNGDSTSYVGGNAFYVSGDGQYTFTSSN
ncbi:MAG: hypothetical protein E7289_05540 [Lachnospiraceae bacterium]|nr:hypothetical protein [Lachnospiraceae bacterium]